MRTKAEVFLLYKEVSDQMGTSEVVGVYSSNSLAEYWGDSIRDRRTFITPITIDSPPRKKA